MRNAAGSQHKTHAMTIKHMHPRAIASHILHTCFFFKMFRLLSLQEMLYCYHIWRFWCGVVTAGEMLVGHLWRYKTASHNLMCANVPTIHILIYSYYKHAHSFPFIH